MTYYICKTNGPLDIGSSVPYDTAAIAHKAAYDAVRESQEDYSVYLVERVAWVDNAWVNPQPAPTFKQLASLLADNQQAWEGEEDSVTSEHKALMKRNEKMLARLVP